MLTTVTPRADRRAPDPATRKPRGKSRHVIIEAKGRDAERYPWFKAFRGAPLSDGPKAVGFSLSTYGDNDGSRNFPGLERLAADHHCDEKTIRRHLEVLVKTGWIRKVREYRAGVNRKFADEYQLTIPDAFVPSEDPQWDDVPPEPDDPWDLWESEAEPSEPEDQWTDLSTGQWGDDDQWTNLSGPLDNLVQPPTDVPTNDWGSSHADLRSAPGRDRPRITAHAATDEGVTEPPKTPRTARVPKQRKASTVSEETRTERDGYIALIPRLSADEVQEVLDELWEVREGVWKWAHDEMRKDSGEQTSKQNGGNYYEPETLAKARLMYVKAFLCTSRSGVWHECLTDPLDALDGA